MKGVYKNRLIITGPQEDIHGLYCLFSDSKKPHGEVFSLGCILPIPIGVTADNSSQYAHTSSCSKTGEDTLEIRSNVEQWCAQIWGTPSEIFNSKYIKIDPEKIILEFHSKESSPEGWVRFLSENVPTYKISLYYNYHPNYECGFMIMDNSKMTSNNTYRNNENLWAYDGNARPEFKWSEFEAIADKEDYVSPIILL